MTERHEVTVSTTPAPDGVRLPFHFRATCSCRRLDSGWNAIKWALLAAQEHFAEVGLTWTQGNLTDGHLVRQQIAEQIRATPHPCHETDNAYCACADLQRKQDAEIAEGADV